MPISVRPATPEDTDKIAPLFDAYRQFYGKASDLALGGRFIRDRLTRQESTVLLAESEAGDAVGFTQLYPSFSSVRAARIFVLNDLFVHPAARGAGVARQLLAAAAEFGRASGAVGMSLSTARTNTTAQKLYESMGWTRDEVFCEYGLTL